jgi:hypothetical protein
MEYRLLHMTVFEAGEDIYALVDQLSQATNVNYGDPNRVTVLDALRECMLHPISRKKNKLDKVALGRVMDVGCPVTLTTKYGKTTGIVHELCRELILFHGDNEEFECGTQIKMLISRITLRPLRQKKR